MRVHRIIGLLLLLFLIGCGANSDSTLEPTRGDSDKDLQLSKISNNKGLDQHVTHRAKEIISGYDEISSIKAANSEKSMIIAIDVKQMQRFKLEELRKDINKEMKDEFPGLDITISTDKKIFLELDQLEKEMETKNISQKELNKRLKDIIELEKEET